MLDRQIKDFIKQSLSELGVTQIKIMVELYGATKVCKAINIIYRINKARGLVLVDRYPLYTKFSRPYYSFDHDNRTLENGFFVKFN